MTNRLFLPRNYDPLLNLPQTEQAIKLIKDTFEAQLTASLELRRVTAPLIVLQGTGVNDDLSGVERKVQFPVKALDDARAEVVNSLAKWKRLALADYGIDPGYGILTDMNALRPDEDLDNLHSIYVDQWDWERHLRSGDRTLAHLQQTVRRIYGAIKRTEYVLYEFYPVFDPVLPEEIVFVHAEELRQMYPELTPAERETEFARIHPAVFVIGIGGPLSDGSIHDQRAPDYDDWTTPNEAGFAGLNGDLLVWNPLLEQAVELSSMGIRVNPPALELQLRICACEDRRTLRFHQQLLSGALPPAIGGGIGQSRLSMFLLRKAHIGEVQSSIWPDDIRDRCRTNRMILL